MIIESGVGIVDARLAVWEAFLELLLEVLLQTRGDTKVRDRQLLAIAAKDENLAAVDRNVREADRIIKVESNCTLVMLNHISRGVVRTGPAWSRQA